MGRRNQAEEINQAADRIVEATKELSFTLNRLIESQNLFWQQFGQQTRAWDPGEYQDRARLSEEEAVQIALSATHMAREEMGRGLDPEERLPAPSPEEVRKRREERRKREGFS